MNILTTLLLVPLAALASDDANTNRPRSFGFNPSQSISPINPSRTLPPRPPVSPLNPGPLHAAPPAPQPASERPLTLRVWIAVTRGVAEARGFPSFGNSGVPVDALRVESDQGKVILGGSVGSERDKAEAGARAEAIAGAGNVVNRLAVRP